VTFLPAHRQGSHALRLEWGPTGAAAIGADVDVAVVVDVLSFTTTLTVAVERGIRVHPFRWKDERAAAYAVERDAVLAGPRGPGVSLSSAAMLEVTGVERIVLPSPNGSAISYGLADGAATVVGASLRNRTAVARWVPPGARVAVVAAGERWPDGSLRPAVEDLWGAGAVLAALVDLGHTGLSPEARVAEQAFRAVAGRLPTELRECASGRELVDAGFGPDVDVAATIDVSEVVPVLRGGVFS
jgi:2-phosphosulfolactate phosphatase